MCSETLALPSASITQPSKTTSPRSSFGKTVRRGAQHPYKMLATGAAPKFGRFFGFVYMFDLDAMSLL